MRIVLASASPRRRELLGQIGLDFEVIVSKVEERATSLKPGCMVEELSRQKAEAVMQALEKTAGETLVIGADTVVVMDGKILGKPASLEDAAGMLRGLSGRTHEVYTGVTLLYRGNKAETVIAGEKGTMADGLGCGAEAGAKAMFGSGSSSADRQIQCKVFHEVTRVTFYPMTEQEISFYVALGEGMDKAGAYGIQGLFARYVKGIEGDYNNVVGLPVGRLCQEAGEWLKDEKSGDI